MDYLTTRTSPSPIRRRFAPGFVNYKKGCTRLTAASDNVYQLLAYGRWFSPVSSTTKTGCHDIAEILLKVALNAKNHHHQSSSMYKEIQYMNHIYQCKKCQYNQLSTGIVLYRTGATSGTGTAYRSGAP